MCFKKNNEHFIRIKLFLEMKGLSDYEKREKYLTELKEEVFNRLHNSYINCNSKIDFYKDAFDVLGFYEGEYLILNLFLEDNCVEITNLLLKNDFIKRININIPNSNSISYYFYNYFISKLYFTDSDLVIFLRKSSIDLTQTITKNDWINENRGSNPLIKKFSTFFIKVDKHNEDMIINGYFIFMKIWNYFDIFLKPFNNTKGILLFYELNKYLENNEYSNFYTFYKKLNKILKFLLVEINFLPIVDVEDNNLYKSGYIKNRKSFLNFMELQKKRSEVSPKMKYSELLTIIFQSNDKLLIEKCEQIILIKINNFEFPDSSEINKIINMTANNTTIDTFFQKLYIY